MLVNYGWNWDLQTALCAARESTVCSPITELIASADASRIDLLVRWGGTRRLSGFLPVQSVYSDFYVVDDLWPDYQLAQFHVALDWYQKPDQTLEDWSTFHDKSAILSGQIIDGLLVNR